MGLKAYSRLHSVFIATGRYPNHPYLKSNLSFGSHVMRSDAEGAFNAIHATLPTYEPVVAAYVHISSAGLLKYPPLDILSVAPKAPWKN